MKQFWNDRYAEDGLAYGAKANDFLVSCIGDISKGKALCLGEGEGRNAVFLAELGFDVVAVDSSEVGLLKADQMAESRGLKIETIVADLADFKIEEEGYDLIISIFCHLPQKLRTIVYKQCVTGLKTGGSMLMESFSMDQLKYKSGGPQTDRLLYSLKEMKQLFTGLELVVAKETVRELYEGKYHTGEAAVLQLFGKKK